MGGNGLISNYLTDCFETQSKCLMETICTPGYSCDNSIPGCIQNCVAERWWHASQNHWDVSSDPSFNSWNPCFKTFGLCSNNPSPDYCDGNSWDCSSAGSCVQVLGSGGQYTTEAQCNTLCTYTGPCYNALNQCNGSVIQKVTHGQTTHVDYGTSNSYLHFSHSASIPQLLTMPNNGIGQDIQIHYNGTIYVRTIIDVTQGGFWSLGAGGQSPGNGPPCVAACGGDIGTCCWTHYITLNQSIPTNDSCVSDCFFNQGFPNQPSSSGYNYTAHQPLGWNVIV